MTHEPKPEEKPHAPRAADPAESDRKKRARKALAEYRKAFPDDDRDDETLMRLPNGPLEIADLHIRHEDAVATRMVRLYGSHANRQPKE